MDLATFRASLRSVLGRDVSDMAISLAVDELTQELTILEMEKRLSLVSASGEIATPADFHRVMKLTRNSDGGFMLPAAEEAASTAVGDAPALYVVRGGYIILRPAPADGEFFGLSYIAKLDPLVNNSDTNAALEYAYDAMAYTTLKHHSALMRDQTAFTFFEGQAGRAITAANQASIKRKWSGGTPRPATDRTMV